MEKLKRVNGEGVFGNAGAAGDGTYLDEVVVCKRLVVGAEDDKVVEAV